MTVIAVAGAVLATGCADSRGGSIPYNRPLAMPDEQRIVPLEADYKIGPMDKIGVQVFKADDMLGEYEVDLTGKISMPLVGEIQVANMTTTQVDDLLTRSSARNISTVRTSASRSRHRVPVS